MDRCISWESCPKVLRRWNLTLKAENMKSNKFTLYAVVTWLLSIGIAYFIGWWNGLKSVANVAASAVDSGMWLVVGVLAIVAVATAIAAFRVRGYLDSKSHST